MSPDQKAAHMRMLETLPSKLHLQTQDRILYSPRKVTDEMERHWRKLRSNGWSLLDIARLYKVCKETVRMRCK